MIKKFPWKTVVVTLLAWMLFWEVKETLTGERQFFLVRWFYSDMSHAKNVEVRTYLLTDEQVSYMLLHPDEPVKQSSNKDLAKKNVNVVLRLRSVTGELVWGRLSWTMPGRGWSVVDVHYIELPGKSEQYSDIIIPMGTIVAEQNNSLPAPIRVKWDSLYVYR